MGSGGVDESDREGIPDGTDFFHATIIDRSDLSGASYFVSREKIAELLEFDSRRDLWGLGPKSEEQAHGYRGGCLCGRGWDPLSGIENGDIILKRSLMESNNNFSGYGYRPGWGIINFFPCKNMGWKWWFERRDEIPFPVYESKCEKCWMGNFQYESSWRSPTWEKFCDNSR